MTVTPNYMPLVRINAPEFYADPGWLRWLNAPDQPCRARPATWHRPSDEPHEHSDVFIAYCDSEGSDVPDSLNQPGIPDHIWEQICQAIEKAAADDPETDYRECLIWVSNLEE